MPESSRTIPFLTRSSVSVANTENRSPPERENVIVLDTDVLTIVQRAASAEYTRLVARLQESPEQPVCITIVSFEEQITCGPVTLALPISIFTPEALHLRARGRAAHPGKKGR
jgi:hypothetical protein